MPCIFNFGTARAGLTFQLVCVSFYPFTSIDSMPGYEMKKWVQNYQQFWEAMAIYEIRIRKV